MTKKPFAPVDNYIEVHRALFTLYTRLPDFKAQHVLMYMYLCDKYNVQNGYAYPTQAQMCEDLGISVNMPGKLAKTLKKYGLIDYKRPALGANYVYYVKAPVTDREEFYRKYPEANRGSSGSGSGSDSEDLTGWL
ncbi:helix-turn-helix domain-containing protein [Paenibacillus larvae]